MSATVGAALKKIAASLLSDPHILKKVLMVVLVLIVAFFTPIMLIYGIFSGGVKLPLQVVDVLLLLRDILRREFDGAIKLSELRVQVDSLRRSPIAGKGRYDKDNKKSFHDSGFYVVGKQLQR